MDTCDRDISIHIHRSTGECEFIDTPGYWNSCKLPKSAIKQILQILKENTPDLK